jgi:arylformamidase
MAVLPDGYIPAPCWQDPPNASVGRGKEMTMNQPRLLARSSRRTFLAGSGGALTLALAHRHAVFAQATPAATPKIVSNLNIAYASRPNSDPNLTMLDVYAPAGAKQLPVMVFVHGGGWRRGDKTYGVEQASVYFCGRGYVYVTVNYRLDPAVQFPGFVDDVAAALAWVKTSIASHGGDPDKIVISGHSAGSQLVCLVGTDERYLNAAGMKLADLRGVIGIDGAAYTVNPDWPISGPQYHDLIVNAFTDDPAVWKDASSVNHVAPGKGIPPYLLFTTPRIGSAVDARALSAALTAAKVDARVVNSPNDTHASVRQNFTVPGSLVATATADWLKTELGL